jgi:hypothetical protein
VKQFVGVCIRAVLEEEEFELVESGARVSKDPSSERDLRISASRPEIGATAGPDH